MNYTEIYRSKLASVEDEIACIRSGDIISTGGEMCEPTAFLENFHHVAPKLDNIELIKGKKGSGLTYPFMAMPELRGKLNMVCHLYDPSLRKAQELGLASHLPSNLHDMMQRRVEHRGKIDKLIVMTSAMDENGNFTVSGCGMWEQCAYENADTVILEVNPNLPRFNGCLTIPIDRVDMIVEVNYPATTYNVRSIPSDTDLAIGAYAADFVHNGDCIQLGLGAMPDAVGNSFFDKKDLGLHTELYTPVMGDLIKAGVINGSRKTVDRGKHVGNFVLGDEKLYRILSEDPNVMFRQASYTNDPFVISQIDNMVSINTAMEIDLTGQICSESIGPMQYSGTGGAFDFAFGAQHSKGGRGIIAIASTAKKGTVSKIKPILTPGSIVTISRNVADIIITEYGVAYMRGRTVKERAEQLINIAHPDFRDELRFEAKKLMYI
ncbi:MAG: hypothetical protein E7430_03060 [Ruminococcaceae bacterium]|nr:hypothetical protein [Oscillospiraceae bacterium]